MNSPGTQFTHRGLSRRQFGLVVAGSASLLLAGGAYGVVARSPQNTTTAVATAFGSLTVVRAGRLARLDAQGRPAFTNLAAAASRLTTGTGDVAHVRRVSTADDPVGGHGHGGGASEDPAGPDPVNLTWGDVILLDVELQNTGALPVLFSPGQLRLRLNSSATSITPQDSDRAPGALAPHGSEHILISYLAPRESVDLDLELEYSDELRNRTLPLGLPPLATNAVRP